MRAAVRVGIFSLVIAAAALPLRASLPRDLDFSRHDAQAQSFVSHRGTEFTEAVPPSSLGVFAPSRERYSHPVSGSLTHSRTRARTNFSPCPFRHRTRYYDRESWLYYYGHRYYDPSTTKWLSKDPKGEAGGWNLTAFCGCDPVNNYDAVGLEPQNVLEAFMPGIVESDAYQLTSSWDDPGSFRALSLSGLGAIDAFTKDSQYAAMAGAGAFALSYAAPAAWAMAGEATAYAGAWGTTLLNTSATAGALAKGGAAALSAYHLYNVVTDPEYRGATMSVDAGTGVSSIGFALKDLWQLSANCNNSLHHKSINLDSLLSEATKNPNANNVVLGKYSRTGISYNTTAERRGATYFQLDNWDDLLKIMVKDDLWQINRKFLDQQWNAGKMIYLSHDPWDATGSFEKELLYLIDLGAKDFINTGHGLWEVVR